MAAHQGRSLESGTGPHHRDKQADVVRGLLLELTQTGPADVAGYEALLGARTVGQLDLHDRGSCCAEALTWTSTYLLNRASDLPPPQELLPLLRLAKVVLSARNQVELEIPPAVLMLLGSAALDTSDVDNDESTLILSLWFLDCDDLAVRGDVAQQADFLRGKALLKLYQRTTDDAYLYRAVANYENMLSQGSTGMSSQAFNDASIAYLWRARKFGGIFDLEAALDLALKALECAPSHEVGYLSGNLGAVYRLLSTMSSGSEYMDLARSAYDRALADEHITERERASYIQNRVNVGGASDDVVESLRSDLAVEMDPPLRLRRTIALVAHTIGDARIDTNPEGVLDALELAAAALELQLWPSDESAGLLANIATCARLLGDRHSAARELADSARRGACETATSPMIRLEVASAWLRDLQPDAADDAMAAADVVRTATLQVLMSQITDADKITVLARFSGVASAVLVALSRVSLPQLGIEAAENLRASVASQRLFWRTGRSAAAASSDGVTPFLSELEMAYRVPLPNRVDQQNRIAQLHASVRDESQPVDPHINHLRIRDLLAMPQVPDLQAKMSADTALVYLPLSRTEGCGLAVKLGGTGEPRVVPVPDLTEQVVSEHSRRYFKAYYHRRRQYKAWVDAFDEMTNWLGEAILGPVIAESSGVTRLILVPFGRMGVLPLHAAWTGTRRSRHYLQDTLAVAFAPNAQTVLGRAPSRLHPTEAAGLVIGAPRVAGFRCPASRFLHRLAIE